MKNYITLFIILLLGRNAAVAQESKEAVLHRLNQTIEQSATYIQAKEQRITYLEKALKKASQPTEKYDLHKQLYTEYQKFKADSAVAYLLKNEQIAIALNDTEKQDETRILLSKLYSVKGMYIEALQLLKAIDKHRLPKESLCEYYDSCYALCSHYGQSINNSAYLSASNRYRDSLLLCIDKQSLTFKVNSAIDEFFTGDKKRAMQQFQQLLPQTTEEEPERAIIAYYLGLVEREKGNDDLQEYYFALSAIADIKNVIKDNASLQGLALTYYKRGNISKAYQFIKMAIDDANFCNVRHRAEESASFYSIINTAYQEKEAKQKKELQLYLVLISVLSVALIIALVYVYKQVKRLIKMRRELSHNNQQLEKLNADLQQMNQTLEEANLNLEEANLIKEEYIARFFNLCSAYIDKIENYRKLLYKKASKHQFDDLTKVLKSTSVVEEELEALYKNFDTIFLNIYPHFVTHFNALLEEGEQILPKKGELLNTELRIFALIRLGITDSNKIAEFLRYSLRTVYNYRTKVRNKAKGERDAFEEKVKRIRD
nr:DUF6377 domain-containing protein [uncultured Capnocytophaga sp.]